MCDEKNGQCKAKLKVDVQGDAVGTVNEHTHPPSETKCEVVRLKSLIKDRAETTRDTPQQILADTLANASETAAINLPRIENLRRTFVHKDKMMQLNRLNQPTEQLFLPYLSLTMKL